MNATEWFLLLFAALCLIAVLAERARLAMPIAFVLGGIALGLIPGFPDINIPPQYILFIFLPPLLMEAAYFTSLREFRFSLQPILQLAVGLVAATILAVGYIAEKMIPGMTFALGCVLGAIISPPDAIAATSTIRYLHVPKRIVSILEGESLVNDATGLVLYGFAVLAVSTGHFSVSAAFGNFLWMVAAGAAIGFGCGYTLIKLFPRIRQPSVEILSTFLMPYLGYTLAETVHASGVLAVVIGGLYTAWHAPKVFHSTFRLTANAIWKMTVFIMNALVFLLIGTKVPVLLNNFSGDKVLQLLEYAAVITLTALVVRMFWVFVVGYGTRFLMPTLRKKDPYPAWQNVFMVGWVGMRGVVSLATALALPLSVADGGAFPMRDEILFITLAVIIFTLVGQGLTLPALLKRLPLVFNSRVALEDWYARQHAAKQALRRLQEFSDEKNIHPPALVRIKSFYEDRLASLGDGPNTPIMSNVAPLPNTHPIIAQEHLLWQEALRTEQESILALRSAFQIGDDVMHELLREIDLLSSRFQST